jgi:hypothetical protein
MEERLETNEQLELAKKYVEETNTNIFLTGKAGTGKTTFLKTLKETTFKRMIVVAPTGVAAINAQGVTIHSFFQVSFGPFIESRADNNDTRYRFSRQKKEIIRSLDLLVIDEISMVRADLLDAIDYTLRRFRKGGKNLPFGGVQLLMIGDLQQLPPVCKDEEWNLLRDYYDTQYFFSSLALKKSNFITINLQKVFRQKDERFINILNNVRNNNITDEVIDQLNNRSNIDFDPSCDEGYVILCTHNYQAQRINENKLRQIDYPSYVFKANITGEFYESAYPNEFELELKREAQVMFVKNDMGEMSKRKYYNGKIGKIVDIDEDMIKIHCPGDDDDIIVKKYVWNNYHYSVNPDNNEIIEESIGTFEQYPIKLAWAITIHKSQGLTFEKVIIDSNKAFASGQVYVALSRCRTLEGIILTSSFNPESIITDQTLIRFDQEQENNPPTIEKLEEDSLEFLEINLQDLFSFKDMKWVLDELQDLNNAYFCKVYNDTSNTISKLINDFNKDIIEVSYKFENQIRILSRLGINEHLIERLLKAIEYYKEKLESVKMIYKLIHPLELDREGIEERKDDNLEALLYELYLKLSLFETIDLNFTLKDYLKKKNEYLILEPKKFIKNYETKHKQKIKSQAKTYQEANKPLEEGEEKPQEILNQELYDTIREWRLAKCREFNISTSQIISQKSLIEIVNTLPKSEKELLEINGIGKKKIQQYGAEILEMVAEYNLLDSSF